ncbi:MAG: lysylphosphatidylglycerol synthase transmembrane domain-containing protein [Patescibacteria group bacterium]
MSIRRTRIPYRQLLFYGVTIAAILLLYLKFSELKLIQQLFRQSNWYYLIGVVIIQILFFVAQAANYRAVLQIKELTLSIRELFPIGYVVQFISQAIPTAGISGQIFFIYYLRKYGLSIAEGIGRAILELASLYVGYAVLFIISVVLLFRKDVFQHEPRFVFFIYAFLLFFLIIGLIVSLSQKRHRATRFHWIAKRISGYFKTTKLFDNAWMQGLANGDYFVTVTEQFRETLGWKHLKNFKGTFALACVWQVVMLFSHVLTLYLISFALGHPIPFAACFVAFTFSKFLSMISVVPGAPGVFEGAMTLILITFGVDKSVALAATLLLRAFTFWLPMPIGWILYGRYLKKFEKIENDKIVVA